jgi:hypothetical protein
MLVNRQGKTMKQTIDFQYPISYVKAGHQNPDHAFGRGSVEVEIREIRADLAPVVFEVGNPVRSYNPTVDLFRKKADGQLRKVAMIDGDFFVEDESAADLSAKMADLRTINSTPFGTVKPASFDINTSWRDGRQSKVETLKPTTDIDEIRRQHGKWRNGKYVSIREDLTKDDGGKQMATDLKKRASEIILVEGTIFLKCREPILTITDYHKELRITERNDRWSPNAPYPKSWRGFSSSLRDSQGFLAFMRKHKLFDGRTGEPEFKVHDASVCRYDGTTSDVQMIANEMLNTFGRDARALPRDILEASFVLEDTLQREPQRLHTISPRLVSALKQLLQTKVEKIDRQQALIAKYQMRRTDLSKYAHYPQSEEQVARSNFHVAAVVHQRKDGSKAVKKQALIALERWEAGAGYDRLPIETTDAMFAVYDDFIVREVNTTWQLRMMSERACADYDDLLAAVLEGSNLLEIAKKPETTTNLYGEEVILTSETSAVVAVNADGARVIANSPALIDDEKTLEVARSYLTDAAEKKIQHDMATAMMKGPKR